MIVRRALLLSLLLVPPSDALKGSTLVIRNSIAPDSSLKDAITDNSTFGGSITVSPPALGNDGFDGNVDDEDSDKWRSEVGTTSRMIVASADCDLWRRYFGTLVGSGSSLGPPTVPEPNAVALGLLTLLTILWTQRR